MSLSETLRTASASIAEAHARMEADTKDAKIRFFAFVDAHNIPMGYAEYPWSPNSPAAISEDVENYFLITGYSHPQGLVFGHDTYDGTETVLIPYIYFDDADAWEAETLAKVAADRQMVEEIVSSFSDQIAFVIEGVRLDGTYGENESISVEISSSNPNVGRYSGINHFMGINRATGVISYASSELKKVLDQKGIEIKR